MQLDAAAWENVRAWISKDLIHLRAWGVKLGAGSFITMEFGKSRLAEEASVVHGEWHLWIYQGKWELRRGESPVVSADSNRAAIASALGVLENAGLQIFDFSYSSPALNLTYDNGHTLKIWADDENDESVAWMLFLPDRRVLSANSNGHWELEIE